MVYTTTFRKKYENWWIFVHPKIREMKWEKLPKYRTLLRLIWSFPPEVNKFPRSVRNFSSNIIIIIMLSPLNWNGNRGISLFLPLFVSLSQCFLSTFLFLYFIYFLYVYVCVSLILYTYNVTNNLYLVFLLLWSCRNKFS